MDCPERQLRGPYEGESRTHDKSDEQENAVLVQIIRGRVERPVLRQAVLAPVSLTHLLVPPPPRELLGEDVGRAGGTKWRASREGVVGAADGLEACVPDVGRESAGRSRVGVVRTHKVVVSTRVPSDHT